MLLYIYTKLTHTTLMHVQPTRAHAQPLEAFRRDLLEPTLKLERPGLFGGEDAKIIRYVTVMER